MQKTIFLTAQQKSVCNAKTQHLVFITEKNTVIKTQTDISPTSSIHSQNRKSCCCCFVWRTLLNMTTRWWFVRSVWRSDFGYIQLAICMLFVRRSPASVVVAFYYHFFYLTFCFVSTVLVLSVWIEITLLNRIQLFTFSFFFILNSFVKCSLTNFNVNVVFISLNALKTSSKKMKYL